MNRPGRQRRLLKRSEKMLLADDPRLGSMFAYFTGLTRHEAMPAAERIEPRPRPEPRPVPAQRRRGPGSSRKEARSARHTRDQVQQERDQVQAENERLHRRLDHADVPTEASADGHPSGATAAD